MTQADYEVLVMRNDCKHPGVTFRSTNVMDYAISDADGPDIEASRLLDLTRICIAPAIQIFQFRVGRE